MYANFVSQVNNDQYHDPESSLLHNLFDKYEKVIFSSIITAFGLDFIIKDQVGGDVDTIYNVRKGTPYKNQKNADDYSNLESYDSSVYHDMNENYRQKKHNARAEANVTGRGVIADDYTGKDVTFGSSAPPQVKATVDHVIAAKTIHNDRGRVLAGVGGAGLANSPENLKITNQSLNSSMRGADIPEYISKHPELPEEQKQKIMDYYNRSQAAYEAKLAKAYYLDPSNPNCRRFYLSTATAAINRGFQMGLRQVLGLVLTEVWFSVRDALINAEDKLQSKLDAIISGIKKGFASATKKYKELIEKFGEGLMSGVIASLTTTLCNIFFTTSKNLSRIIRQSWSSVVEATKILYFNPSSLYFSDRVTEAAIVLAMGACVVIGASAQEAVRANLSPSVTPFLADIIATFVGSLCTGLLSVSLLFVIDYDPFDRYLLKAYNDAIKEYKKQARMFNDFCATLESYDIKGFSRQTSLAYDIAVKIAYLEDDFMLNRELKKAVELLGVECPWGEEDFDSFWKKPDSRLVFKA